jgi:hypothetical protein
MQEQLDTTLPIISFFNNNRVKKTLAVLIIVTLLYPVINYGVGPLYAFFATAYSYEEFLNNDFSLAELVTAVNLRVHYRSEPVDTWYTPAAAWEMRAGDCEEKATLCAAYLVQHHVACYLAGLNVPKNNTAHAVVFIKADKLFYIMDPTGALEPEKFKALPNFIASLRQAVLHYAPLPALIYKIPAFNGEKKVIEALD